jgi:hypothetical protein
MTAVSALKNAGEKFPLDTFLMMACCSSCDNGILQTTMINQSINAEAE